MMYISSTHKHIPVKRLHDQATGVCPDRFFLQQVEERKEIDLQKWMIC